MKNVVDADTLLNCYEKNRGNSLKTLVGLYKGKYHCFVFSSIFYIIKHSPAWIMPIVTANIINYITEGAENVNRLIVLNATVVAVLLILNFPMNYLHVHFRASAIRAVEAGLRNALIRKIQSMSILTEKDIQSGRLQSKIIRDVEAIETLSDQLFVNLINIIVNLVVALSVTVFKSRVVFIFFLLLVPVAAGVVYLFKKPIKIHNQKFRKMVESASARVMEMVELVPVTRAHALETREVERMERYVNDIAEEGYQLDMVQTNFGAVSWVCFQLFQVVCLVFTAFLSVRGVIHTGDVVLYQSYFTTIVGQITSLLNLIPTISKGLESVNSIGEVLMLEDMEDNEGKLKLEDVRGEFEFDHVSYKYPGTDKIVIDNLNLTVKAGQTIAFVGESGAGKTTIINLIIGFIMPTSGRLFIDGNPIEDIDLHSYRESLAVVPQNTVLFSGSIRENILYGTDGIDDATLDRVIEEAGLKKVIENLTDGLDTKVGEHGDRLSGGQKQRISIARALIRDPKIIILDEATSALDAISEKEVSGALDNISFARTTFIVAHKLSTVKNSDRIIVMQDGRIAEDGTFDELVEQKGYFYRLSSALSD
ncbi:MAG: ABC transporter ATP-binding protein/permease [Lachnospiraceae bacterium]|nr:ABC transporter ATP-binding protein/permease [Lachnospiraceae bacterium]